MALAVAGVGRAPWRLPNSGSGDVSQAPSVPLRVAPTLHVLTTPCYQTSRCIVCYIRPKVADPMDVFPGISMSPDVRFGKPCIAGTRMDVATVVGLIAAGETVETVAGDYQLSNAHVRAALAYAAHVAAHLTPAVPQAS